GKISISEYSPCLSELGKTDRAGDAGVSRRPRASRCLGKQSRAFALSKAAGRARDIQIARNRKSPERRLGSRRLLVRHDYGSSRHGLQPAVDFPIRRAEKLR